MSKVRHMEPTMERKLSLRRAVKGEEMEDRESSDTLFITKDGFVLTCEQHEAYWANAASAKAKMLSAEISKLVTTLNSDSDQEREVRRVLWECQSKLDNLAQLYSRELTREQQDKIGRAIFKRHIASCVGDW